MPNNLLLLKRARKLKGLSQEDVAKALKVDVNTYSRWERGIQEPHGYNLQRLCQVLGHSMEELGYAPSFENQQGPFVQLTSEQAALIAPMLGDTMNPERRNILRLVVGATSIAVAAPLTSLIAQEPWERLVTEKASNLNVASIAHFRDLMETCWKLSNSGELSLAENILAQFLPRLKSVAPALPEAATLVSQGLQLQSILVAHNLKLTDKIALCQQSVAYVRNASEGNKNTLVAGLAQLAIAYQYAGQPQEALATYQEALRCQHISPLLQSRIYMESAAMLAKYGRYKEASFYMDLSRETYPALPEEDPSFLFADCSGAILALHEGIAHLHMGQPTDAWKSFERQIPGEVVPARIELEVTNHKGQAAIDTGNLDLYVQCLADGLSGASQLGSQKRYKEAITIFQGTPVTWRQEQPLKQIIEQYSL